MSRISWTTFWVFLFVLAIGFSRVGADETRTRGISSRLAQAQWYDDADQTFRLGRGMGRQLMTQQEWREHQQKMRGMSVEERNRYREEWHNRLMERARQEGVGMPNTPGPNRGSGMGQGMGYGAGMGHGGMGGYGGMGGGGGMGHGGRMGGGGRR